MPISVSRVIALGVVRVQGREHEVPVSDASMAI